MKKYGLMLSALLVCGAVFAGVTEDITIRQVRDPVKFQAIWNDSMAYLIASTNNHGAVTNATLDNETGAITATAVVTPQAPGAQTPTITITKQVGEITATAVITPETISLTDTNGVTAVVWTNATCAVTIVGGGAVMTNATAACSALLNYATNATAAITVVGGDAVTTNTTITLEKVP